MPEPELTKPVAAFTADQTAGDAPLTVQFSNTSTGVIAGYVWSFGDGSVSHDKEPSHVYADPGNYPVTLTVFNAEGSDVETLRVDITAPDVYDVPSIAETVGDLIPSIRAALRRPSEQKLRYKDILDVINDLLRGYSRDLNVSELDHRTDEAQCVLSHIGGNDYLLTIPGITEVEAMQLKFLRNASRQSEPNSEIWTEATIVPLDYYAERASQDRFIASFYAGVVVDDGVKVKLSLDKETVENSVWKIRYRKPIIRLLTIAAKTPLPADFLPMLKLEAVLMSLPRMRDDTEAFYDWRKANQPIFVQQIADWRERWDAFLNTSTQPNRVPKTAANSYRGFGGKRPQHTVERGRTD